MKPAEFSLTLKRISQFWRNFFSEQSADEIFQAWYPFFRDDDADEVNKAVIMLACSLKFPPTIADIKTQMAENVTDRQLTAMQAFNRISDAVDRATSRQEASKEFKALSPILRETVGSPSRLISWRKVSEEAFQTVIMSAIRESYNALLKREAKRKTYPKAIQASEALRLAEPEPEPEQVEKILPAGKLVEMELSDDLMERHREGLEAFLKPVTEAELKAAEAREKAKAERFL